MKAESHLEALLLALIRAEGLPEPVRQFRLVPGRRFAADFAWPGRWIYCEVDGATWTNGRHARGSGIEADAEKTSLAACGGWRLIRVTRQQIEDGRALAWLKQALMEEAA